MDWEYVGQLVLVVVLALIPALIWLRIWKGRNTNKKAKRYMLYAFLLGSLTVFPVLLVHYIWEVFPQTDIINLIAQTKIDGKQKIIIVFTILAVVEEIAKFLVVFFIDKSSNLVRSIHDAIKFGVVAGLGFAFAENIYYFYTVGTDMPIIQFLALFSFRSLVTVCGHLIFSGIFGNYYGVSKFSRSYATHEYWGKSKKFDKRALSDKDLERKAFVFQKVMIAKGLFFASAIHACFNYFLEQGMISYVLWLIGLCLVYLIYLYRRRSGYINVVYRRSKFSHMRDKDKDVVLELLGMWYKEGKYLQVIETSKRLLKKDPNNPLVRLFMNKAVDNQRFIDAYTAIRNLFVPKNYLEGLDEDSEEKSEKKVAK
ncbi:PrsW family intramembrane metalloprotease [Patescibacteria group bacterium]